MKADARPSREKEALEFAANFFRDYNHEFSAEGNWLARKEALAKETPNEQEKAIRGLGGLALFKGDIRAIEMLCDLAARYIEEKRRMPKSLRIFTCLFLRHPFTTFRSEGEKLVPGEKIKSKPGPHPQDRSNRNQAICVVIEAIRYHWGFDATRSPASKGSAKHVSAASIVRDALEQGVNINLTEAAVNKIWNDWRDRSGESFEDFMARTSP
jgi:hypothetical protein